MASTVPDGDSFVDVQKAGLFGKHRMNRIAWLNSAHVKMFSFM